MDDQINGALSKYRLGQASRSSGFGVHRIGQMLKEGLFFFQNSLHMELLVIENVGHVVECPESPSSDPWETL